MMALPSFRRVAPLLLAAALSLLAARAWAQPQRPTVRVAELEDDIKDKVYDDWLRLCKHYGLDTTQDTIIEVAEVLSVEAMRVAKVSDAEFYFKNNHTGKIYREDVGYVADFAKISSYHLILHAHIEIPYPIELKYYLELYKLQNTAKAACAKQREVIIQKYGSVSDSLKQWMDYKESQINSMHGRLIEKGFLAPNSTLVIRKLRGEPEFTGGKNAGYIVGEVWNSSATQLTSHSWVVWAIRDSSGFVIGEARGEVLALSPGQSIWFWAPVTDARTASWFFARIEAAKPGVLIDPLAPKKTR